MQMLVLSEKVNYKDAYEKRAACYEDRYGGSKHKFYELERDIVFKHLQPRPRERILDLGTGTGYYARELSKKKCEVVGIDVSEGMLRIAKSKDSEGAYVLGDIESIIFKRKFDKVVGAGMLEYLSPRGFVGLSKTVKRGGIVVLTGVFNYYSPWRFFFKFLKPKDLPYKVFKKRDLQKIGEKHDFELDNYENYFLIPPIAVKYFPIWTTSMENVASKYLKVFGTNICTKFRRI